MTLKTYIWAAALAAVAGAAPAGAQGYGRPQAHPHIVTTESHWGNGIVSGPVRPGRSGWQVRLPRGTWVDCGRSCPDTLRRQTVDYWESNGPQSKNDGPNYFRWEFRF